MTGPFVTRREAIRAGWNRHREALSAADNQWAEEVEAVRVAAHKRRAEAIAEADEQWEEAWTAADKECDEALARLLEARSPGGR
jgi:hypothetical protein